MSGQKWCGELLDITSGDDCQACRTDGCQSCGPYYFQRVQAAFREQQRAERRHFHFLFLLLVTDGLSLKRYCWCGKLVVMETECRRE